MEFLSAVDGWGQPLTEAKEEVSVSKEIFDFFFHWDNHYGDRSFVKKFFEKPNVQEWIKKYCCPPSKTVTVFRGMHFSVEDWGGIDQIKQALGAKKDIGPGSVLTYTDKSLSSWTKDPNVAESFSSDGDPWEMQVVMKATIPSSKVVLDFDFLPSVLIDPEGEKLEIRKKEKEVLVLAGSYSGTVVHFKADEKNEIRVKVKKDWGLT